MVLFICLFVYLFVYLFISSTSAILVKLAGNKQPNSSSDFLNVPRYVWFDWYFQWIHSLSETFTNNDMNSIHVVHIDMLLTYWWAMTVTEVQQGIAQGSIILIGLCVTRNEIPPMYLEVVCAVSIPIRRKHVQGLF